MLQKFGLGDLLAASLPSLKERLPDMPDKVLKVTIKENSLCLCGNLSQSEESFILCCLFLKVFHQMCSNSTDVTVADCSPALPVPAKLPSTSEEGCQDPSTMLEEGYQHPFTTILEEGSQHPSTTLERRCQHPSTTLEEGQWHSSTDSHMPFCTKGGGQIGKITRGPCVPEQQKSNHTKCDSDFGMFHLLSQEVPTEYNSPDNQSVMHSVPGSSSILGLDDSLEYMEFSDNPVSTSNEPFTNAQDLIQGGHGWGKLSEYQSQKIGSTLLYDEEPCTEHMAFKFTSTAAPLPTSILPRLDSDLVFSVSTSTRNHPSQTQQTFNKYTLPQSKICHDQHISSGFLHDDLNCAQSDNTMVSTSSTPFSLWTTSVTDHHHGPVFSISTSTRKQTSNSEHKYTQPLFCDQHISSGSLHDAGQIHLSCAQSDNTMMSTTSTPFSLWTTSVTGHHHTLPPPTSSEHHHTSLYHPASSFGCTTSSGYMLPHSTKITASSAIIHGPQPLSAGSGRLPVKALDLGFGNEKSLRLQSNDRTLVSPALPHSARQQPKTSPVRCPTNFGSRILSEDTVRSKYFPPASSSFGGGSGVCSRVISGAGASIKERKILDTSLIDRVV